MKHETIKDLISNIKKHEEVDINWVLDKNSDEARLWVEKRQQIEKTEQLQF